jgi:hypothetical protein
LRHDLAASGRVWLLLRHIDTEGRGWIELSQARHTLTKKESPLRVCGWRQLRNLMRQGQGVFWQRDSTRIWLHSVANVAAALEVPRLTGQPVAIPVSALLEGVGSVRAYFYATFHSQHSADKPISRETIKRISSVPTRTQRIYERRSGIKAFANYAIGPIWTNQANREQSWRRGHATFGLIDHHGDHGKPGQKYVAWRLPNHYSGSLRRTSQGRKKHLNHSLKDLVKKRAQGNSSIECQRVFLNSSTELVDFGRKTSETGQDQFWRAKPKTNTAATSTIWYAKQ